MDFKDVFAICDYNTVYEIRLKDAINRGYLVPFRYYGIYDDTVNYDNLSFKKGSSFDKRQENGNNNYPDDCFVDFDLQVIDLFNKLKLKEMTIKDKIKIEYVRVKDLLGHRPSRVEFFTNIDSDVYFAIKKLKSDLNPFNDYLSFLKDCDDINDDEKKLLLSRGFDFIKMIENTSMSKSYKIPVLLAFYNKGSVKLKLNENDIYYSFYNFYNSGTNKADMLKDKATNNYLKWTKKQYISLAKINPIKFLLKTHNVFLKIEEGFLICLYDEMQSITANKSFLYHMRDSIEYRKNKYYSERIR